MVEADHNCQYKGVQWLLTAVRLGSSKTKYKPIEASLFSHFSVEIFFSFSLFSVDLSFSLLLKLPNVA